jgi:hypothetical protein
MTDTYCQLIISKQRYQKVITTVISRGTDNTMAKRKVTKRQTMVTKHCTENVLSVLQFGVSGFPLVSLSIS